MAFTMSRSGRITFLLVVDIAFFFVEIIVGYTVGSLALVADSFHMLNDVLSLIIALYAIKLTKKRAADTSYTYGWNRAEILAALFNGVFLLALCFSISLEAIQRFAKPQEVANAKLVVIVGSLGLAFNVLGLFLFHEHGHSHSHASNQIAVRQDISVIASSGIVNEVSLDALPHNNSRDLSAPDSCGSLEGHPAATRASLVQAAQDLAQAHALSGRSSSEKSQPGHPPVRLSAAIAHEARAALSYVDDPEEDVGASSVPMDAKFSHPQLPIEQSTAEGQTTYADVQAQANSHDHGHSHGSMNMRAIVLHVLGDALGNIGVIVSGLIIWLSTWSGRYYFDPTISLVIAIIIFSSALPLVRSTSYILLQRAPSTVSFDEVQKAILDTDGVLSVHELHIWQLSESKVVASVHVTASRDHDFMVVAEHIREALHTQGIHSSTIQPEYHPVESTDRAGTLASTSDVPCLIVCPPDQACATENTCCPPRLIDV